MIVLIDGDCALCVGLIEWLGKRIPPEKITPEQITIVPGHSDWGLEILKRSGITDFDSVVVVKDAAVLQESIAVLALAELLPLRWRIVAALARIVPKGMSNALYLFIARNRLKWFGRKEVCALNSPIAAVTYGPRGLLQRPD